MAKTINSCADSTQSTSLCSSKLSFKELYSQSLGMVIGAGIITSTGFCIGYTGSGVWLAYILAGITVLIAYLPSILGGSVVPRTSGSYFMACQIHPVVGGFYSLMLLFSCISIGFMGASFAKYMTMLVSFGSYQFWGILVLSIFFLANLLDQKQIVKIQTFQNVILVLAWASFVFLGMGKINWNVILEPAQVFSNGFKGMYEAVTMLVFAMGGGLWLIDSGERIENPKKNVLLGNLACTSTAMILFALISIVAAGVLPIPEVANQPLTKVAKVIYPGAGYIFFIAGGVMMALCTTINARFMAAANGLLRSSMEGWFPKSLSRQNKNNVPYYFLTIVYVISILPVVFNLDIKVLNRLSAAITLFSMLIPNIGFMFLIRKFPNEWKNSRWHMPMWATIVLYILCNGIMLVLIAKNISTTAPFLMIIAGCLLAVFAIYAVIRAPYTKVVMETQKKE